jgi:hypothetical protein
MSKKTREQRERECTLVSVAVSNYLHDARLLDANGVIDELNLEVDAVIDGDIPVHIKAEKKWYGPVSLHWELWSEEPGRRTRGFVVIHRLTGTKALLQPVSYERSCKRSPRLAALDVACAKWGLRASSFDKYGIETTY